MIPDTVPFVCLAVGDLEGRADLYLNRLYSMLERHCHVPFSLTCFSDRPRKLQHDIQIRPASALLSGTPQHPTYYKLGLFKAEATPFEQFLYLDMSLVMRQDMSALLQYAFGAPQDLVIVNEWKYEGYNSCVMRIKGGALQTIYDAFIEGARYPEQVEGDQDFIRGHIKAHQLEHRVALFPAEQVISYKWTRNYSEEGPQQMARAQQIVRAATIVKFHGNPKMHHIAKRFRNLFKSMDSSLFKRELYQNWR